MNWALITLLGLFMFGCERVAPRPKDWNKSTADLFEELRQGKRKSLQDPELRWAAEYDKESLPKNMTVPHAGEIYEAITEVDVDYLVQWKAPLTTGGKGRLDRGERVRISLDPPEQATAVCAEAVNKGLVERRLVPKAEREDAKYAGFYFVIPFVTMAKAFKRVE